MGDEGASITKGRWVLEQKPKKKKIVLFLMIFKILKKKSDVGCWEQLSEIGIIKSHIVK